MPKKFTALKLVEPLGRASYLLDSPEAGCIVPRIDWNPEADEDACNSSGDRLIPKSQRAVVIGPEHRVEHHPARKRPLSEELDEETAAPITLCIADVAKRDVEWLWEGRIVKNAINLLDGDPGILKTYVALHLCAVVTRGRAMPGDEHRTDLAQGSILYLSSEDRPDTTLRPRLEAAGANLGDCHALDPSLEVEDEPYFFDLGDMDKFEAEIKLRKPVLVVLDPLMGLMPFGSQTNAETEMRPILRQLDALCEKHEFTVLAIRHCRKLDTKAAVLAGGGSIGIAAQARSVLFMGKDPKNPGASILTVAKNNHARTPTSLTCEVIHNVFQWTGTSLLTADALAQSRGNVGNTKTDDAKLWLVDRLKGCRVPVKTLMQEAEIQGFKRRTVERAKKELGDFILASGQTSKRCWMLQSGVKPAKELPVAAAFANAANDHDAEDDDGIEMADEDWDALIEGVAIGRHE